MADKDRADSESTRVQFPLDSDSYKILSQLPVTGVVRRSTVYKAECLPLSSKLVAIKAIDFDRRSGSTLIDLICGAETLATSLCHPNVLNSYCSFIGKDRRFWVVMPFMPAGSVYSVMGHNLGYGVSVDCVAIVMREVLKGLAYLHQQGETHKDIKAGNIIMGLKGSVKLADFGISEPIYDPESGFPASNSSSLDDTNAPEDVPYWIAPENVYSPKSDIWTFGVVAMELTYGRPPLSELPKSKSLLLRFRKRFGMWGYERKKINNIWDVNMTDVFRDMVALCLDHDPAKRPTAEELLRHPYFSDCPYGSEIIEQDFIKGYPTVEHRRIVSLDKDDDDDEDIKEGEIPDYLLNDGPRSSFISAWRYNRETFLLEPEFRVVSRTESLVERINDWNQNAAAATSSSGIAIDPETRDTLLQSLVPKIESLDKQWIDMTMAILAQEGAKGRVLTREEEMAQEIEVLKVTLETQRKKNSVLKTVVESLRAQIAERLGAMSA